APTAPRCAQPGSGLFSASLTYQPLVLRPAAARHEDNTLLDETGRPGGTAAPQTVRYGQPSLHWQSTSLPGMLQSAFEEAIGARPVGHVWTGTPRSHGCQKHHPISNVRNPMTWRFTCCSVVITLLFAGRHRADDWPQWRGPARTGVSKEKGLLREWPKDGPKLLWEKKEIGGGYSTPAVVGDRIYLMSDRKGEEFVVALAVKDGAEVWSTAVGKVGPNVGQQYPGTRSTPTVEGDRVYALGSDGDLVCLEKDGGKKVWSKSLRK